MTVPAAIVVTLYGDHFSESLIETGVTLADALQITVRGVILEDTALSEFCDLPRRCLPPGLAEVPSARARPAMSIAATLRTRRLQREVELYVDRRRFSIPLSIRSGTRCDVLSEVAAAGELLILPIDLSTPHLAEEIEAAVALCPPSGAILMVPERRPTRRGAVVALVSSQEDLLVVFAQRVAEGLHTALAVVLPDTDAWQSIARLAGVGLQGVDTATNGGLRLIACRKEHLGLMLSENRDHILRESRASLLVMA